MKELQKDCIANLLQFNIDSLHTQLQRKEALNEDLNKEMDKLRQLMVQAPEKAGANKDAPSMVRERRGGDGGRTNGVSFFSGGCRKAADCQRADKGRRTLQCSSEGNRLD